MGHVQTRAAGTILAFPGQESRPARSAIRVDEPRGEILLFTGVRYERQPEPSPEPLLSAGQPRSRKRRR